MGLKDIFKEKAYEKKGNWLTTYNHFSTFCKDLENFDIQTLNAYSINFSKMKSNLETWVSNAKLNRAISFKIFRNSFAVRNVTRLIPAKQIQKIMGYANIASARIFEDVVIKRAPKTISA